ncbi:DMT family transporter [Micromonospora sonneratiae]|uniref:DMT family transporter n=1 Tax=Micromonospora sonneratiae TaxID=1184706 RepID=A0ABW3YK45_9ACTN
MSKAVGLRSVSRSGLAVLAAYVALSLTWGSSFFSIKIAVNGLSPQQLVLGRLVLGAVTLNLILLVTRRRWPRDLTLVRHLAVVGFLLCVLPLLLFAWAAQHIPSGLSSIYNATTPLMTMAIGVAVLPAEKMGPLRSAGILVGAVGILIVLAPWQLLQQLNELSGTGLAQLACLVGTASYGLAFTYLRRFVTGRYDCDAATVAAVQVTLSAGMMLVVSPFFIATPMRFDTGIVLSLVVLGVLASGIAYIWNTLIVNRWGATPASTVTYVSPLVGVALGIIALDESLSWNQPVGAVIVIAGIMLSQGLIGGASEKKAPAADRPLDRSIR